MSELDIRIRNHPVVKFEKNDHFTFRFEGQKIIAYRGETIGAALHAAGITALGESRIRHRPQGLFCMIGDCSSCLMKVDGASNIRVCTTLAKPGIFVERQSDQGELGGMDMHEIEHEKIEAEVAVVGTGPAGLKSALCAADLGAEVAVVDQNPLLGGQLIKQTHKFFGDEELYAGFRGPEIAKMLDAELRKRRVTRVIQSRVIGSFPGKKHVLGVLVENSKFIELQADRVVVATGASENMLSFPNWDLPGVFAAGGVQTMMNVYGVRPGNRALMIGSGNVGLIVAYQMIQAGIEVEMILEAAPRVGGYEVHAAKLRRLGVPILTSHSIVRAIGRDHVQGAIVARLDEKSRPISQTEKHLGVDLICIAVGMSPCSELLLQSGCESRFMSELGGHVALYDENMETSVKGIYVAGDAAGIEEASSAMMEGEIAGASAASSLGLETEDAEKRILKARNKLVQIRKSPFSRKAKDAKERIFRMSKEIRER